MDVKILNYEDKNYPRLLKSINKPPKQLYVLGNIELLNSNLIAIVGSRACSTKGAEYARQFARELSSARNWHCKWNGKRNRY